MHGTRAGDDISDYPGCTASGALSAVTKAVEHLYNLQVSLHCLALINNCVRVGCRNASMQY